MKTIIHIPNVNSKESTQKGKLEEVQNIYDIIGRWDHKDENNVDYIEAPDGRMLKVANLVERRARIPQEIGKLPNKCSSQ